MLEVKAEKYFVVTSKFECQEYLSLDQATVAQDKVAVIVQQQLIDSTNQTTKYVVQFVNENSFAFEKKINIQGWSALISTTYNCDREAHYYVVFKFSSPEGLVKQPYYQGSKGISGVVIAIRKLHEMIRFKTWDDYELAEENKRLKAENEVLKNKIVELQNELTLKSTSA